MFESNDEAYLLSQLKRARAVLFAGAGFSASTENRLGVPIPRSRDLSEQLWKHLSYDGPYDGTPLDQLFESALEGGSPYAPLQAFLCDQLLCGGGFNSNYESLQRIFWHRIYTTNIDDVLEKAFEVGAPVRIDSRTFPKDDSEDRDSLLEVLQIVHLNGRLPCSPSEITFSPRQYAKASVTSQPLYDQFARDYATQPVVFIGTELNESLLWRAIEQRSVRGQEISERRPRSFLVSPRITQPKRVVLRKLNVVPVEATIEDFLQWIEKNSGALPSKKDVLELVAPDTVALLAGASSAAKRSRIAFSQSFVRVPVSRSGNNRSQYLLGASPRWEDLLQELDAPRDATKNILQYALQRLDDEAHPEISIGAIVGSAGCGKSTVLRRVGILLEQAGHSAFLTNSEALPKPEQLRAAVDDLPSRAILLFDNAEVALGRLATTAQSLNRCTRPPLMLIASRTNDFDRLAGRLSGKLQVDKFPLGILSSTEIDAVISVLESNGLLGALTGMKPAERIAVFESKAQKQLLVAMREATSGRGFDEIIEDEFTSLQPRETQLLYLCVALATDAGYRLSKQEFIASARVGDAEASHILVRGLRDIVLPTGPDDSLLMLRHRAIATYVLDSVASKPQLRDAYTRLLESLSLSGTRRRGRPQSLSRRLLNHKLLYRRFSGDLDEARELYRGLARRYERDPHFWLQFGNLELEGSDGDLRRAENYVASAYSLYPSSTTIQNAQGHLWLRQAVDAPSFSVAEQRRERGTETLMKNVERYGDEYAIHILASQRYRWAKKWLFDNDSSFLDELKWLKGVVASGRTAHPNHRRLRELAETLEQAYLQTAIPRDKRPEPPTPQP